MAAHVRVRMYNVGFGDCFLVTVPGRERRGKLLVDCGVHNAGPGPRPMEEVVARIVEDVTDGDGVPRIDVVVGTHRHQDHVSGFEEPAWQDVEVGEVWLPWTEDPRDPQARRIRERQSRTARLLFDLLAAHDPGAGALAFSANSLTNEEAMATLHRGFAGRPIRRFLPRPDPAESSFQLAGLPGAQVHVLGPSRDPEVIRDMDPPKGESFLRLVDPDAASATLGLPFHEDWAIGQEEFLDDPRYAHLAVSPTVLARIARLGTSDPLAVAVALEKAVNGTSLMLMLEVGRAFLLFPGDAQWGTWQAAMADPGRRELMARTTFYKVGHHGSHNATPREFVEEVLGDDFWSMVSVRPIRRWKHIPKRELLERLAEKSDRVVRSDQPGNQVVGVTFEDDLFADAEIPV